MESGFWRYFRKGAPGYWERIENTLAKGIPDTVGVFPDNFMAWVELKDLPLWKGTLGLSAEQRLWHRRWARKGGVSWVLARHQKQYLLIKNTAILDSGTLLMWHEVATKVWHNRIDWVEFERIIRGK